MNQIHHPGPTEIFNLCHERYRSCSAALEGKLIPNRSTQPAVEVKGKNLLAAADYRIDFEYCARWRLPERWELAEWRKHGNPNPHAEQRQLRRLFEVYVVQDPLNFVWYRDPMDPGPRLEVRGSVQAQREAQKGVAVAEELDAQERQNHYNNARAAMKVRADVFDLWWGKIQAMVGAELARRRVWPLGKYFSEPSERRTA